MAPVFMNHYEIQLVAQAAGFPDPNKAAAIAMAESSGRPWVVNSIGCVGLWQINQPVHVKSHPKWTREWLKDPANNAKAAYLLSNGGSDWSAWEAYTGKDGKGSDGPWRDYVKGGEWHDQVGDAIQGPIDAAGDAIDATEDIADQISRVAQALGKLGNWTGNPRNWVRVGYVVGGAVLVVVGLQLIARDTPLAKGARQVAGAVVTRGKSAAGRRADARKSRARVDEAYAKTRARAQARKDAKNEDGDKS